ncbi:MAG: gliding motility-associated protein GldE [Alistipes sp.]|nr:gliding motility-associated protein GldE [Alistipes sp.]
MWNTDSSAWFADVAWHAFTLREWMALLGMTLLLGVSACVSASETAFFSLSPRDVNILKKRTDRASRRVLRLLSRDQYLLATILIVNNLVNICVVVLANGLIDASIDFGASVGLELGVKLGLVTFLLLLFGEIMPKIFSAYHAVGVARGMGACLSVLESMMRPLAFLLIRSGNYINQSVNRKRANISMDELSNAIEMTSGQSAEEKRMLSEIVDFVHTEVVEVMKPRVDMVALDWEANFEAVCKEVVSSGFSRIPVYKERIDDIQGVLYVKDLLPYILASADFEWQHLIRKPYFVPEHKKINELLEEFRHNHIHMAIVVDEYGSTQGLLTLEDILEEVVGEIADESDREEAFYTKLAENLYVFEGKTHLNDFLEVVGLPDDYLDAVRGDAETIAGVMLEIRKDFLRRAEKLSFLRLNLTVEALDGRRIDKVRVEVLPPREESGR